MASNYNLPSSISPVRRASGLRVNAPYGRAVKTSIGALGSALPALSGYNAQAGGYSPQAGVRNMSGSGGAAAPGEGSFYSTLPAPNGYYGGAPASASPAGHTSALASALGTTAAASPLGSTWSPVSTRSYGGQSLADQLGSMTGTIAKGPQNAYTPDMMSKYRQQGLNNLQAQNQAANAGIGQASSARGVAGPNIGSLLASMNSAGNRGALANSAFDAELAGQQQGVSNYNSSVAGYGALGNEISNQNTREMALINMGLDPVTGAKKTGASTFEQMMTLINAGLDPTTGKMASSSQQQIGVDASGKPVYATVTTPQNWEQQQAVNQMSLQLQLQNMINSGQLANTVQQGQNANTVQQTQNQGQIANTTLQGSNATALQNLVNSGQLAGIKQQGADTLANTIQQGQNANTVQQTQNQGNLAVANANLKYTGVQKLESAKQNLASMSDKDKYVVKKTSDGTSYKGADGLMHQTGPQYAVEYSPAAKDLINFINGLAGDYGLKAQFGLPDPTNWSNSDYNFINQLTHLNVANQGSPYYQVY